MTTKKTSPTISYRYFLLVIASITVTAVVCFGIVQHLIRQSANNPQLFLSQEIAGKLSQGEPPQKKWFGPGKKVDLNLDSRLFYIIYNDQFQITTTSAFLNDQPLDLPQGVLETAQAKGLNAITWQPAPGVREAIAVRPYKSASQSGYIVVGQSLDRFEELIHDIGVYILIGWLVIGGGMLATLYAMSHKKGGQ